MFHGCTSTGRVGLCFLWFYVQEFPKAQPAVVLVLKRLSRQGNGLKSHPADWEKPGIEPATPGLQDIGLSPTPRWLLWDYKLNFIFWNIPTIFTSNLYSLFPQKMIIYKQNNWKSIISLWQVIIFIHFIFLIKFYWFSIILNIFRNSYL